MDTIVLNPDNTFFKKFDSLTPGLYSFKHEPEYQYIYFDKNDSLMVRINSQDFDESIVFCGRGEEKNNFLMELYLKNEHDRGFMFNVFDEDVAHFNKKIDSSFQSKKKFYDEKKESIGWDDDFDQYAIAMLDFFHYSKKELYPVVHKMRSGSDIEKGSIIERPKVIYNAKTGKFVMWFHLELKSQGYNAARTAVATSDSPTGPFVFHKSLRPNPETWPINFEDSWKEKAVTEADLKAWSDEWKSEVAEGLFIRRDFGTGQMARDMTLYVDEDGKGYHIYSSEENLTLHIAELTDDYLGFTGKWAVIEPAGHNEAPAIFKQDGKYYLITSGCTGWDPNAARSFVADDLFGPWISLGNPAIGEGADLTFDSQSTFIIPVQGKKDAFIFMADRWRPQNAIDGRYVWLPIRMKDGRPVLEWRDEWDLSVFD